MKKIILIVIVFCTLHSNCVAQKEIVYSFESSVIDSLQSGISMYAKLLNKAEKNLKLYAVVIENNNEFEIFLQEYSHLAKSGLLELIKNTNRKLQISNAATIPIVIPADKMSIQVRKDKIAAIPLSGYYIKVVYENYIQKVVQTSISF
jgi:hypothetical protein